MLTETRPTPDRSNGDLLMRKVLRIDDSAEETNEEAQSAFQKSIIISAIRCTLTYVLIPFVVPVLGFAAAVDAPLGIALSLVAIVSVTYSLRKFFGSDHPRRWQYASLAGVLLARLGADHGIARGELLHVAQSRFHDVAPASALGLATCWVDRRGDAGTAGGGATAPSTAEADVTVPDMAALAGLLTD